MTTQTEKPKRRRGAPLGNSNALRHGFYSRQFKRFVQRDLDGHEFEGLTDEITMLRVVLRQIFEDVSLAKDPLSRLEAFRVVSLGCSSLSRLVRTQHIISPEGSDLDAALSEAIHIVRDEWRNKPSDPPMIEGWTKKTPTEKPN